MIHCFRKALDSCSIGLLRPCIPEHRQPCHYCVLSTLLLASIAIPVVPYLASSQVVATSTPLNVPETIINSLGVELVLLEPGEFVMHGWGRHYFEVTRVPPSITRYINEGFYIGRYEITQKQWRDVMGTQPWQGDSNSRVGDDYPASFVTRGDAIRFCKILSRRENRTYRLPTEAEWEYACKAGTRTRFFFGDDATKLSQYAWYQACDDFSKVGGAPNRVGQRLPNPWGLYDILGNVEEWVSDDYGFDPDFVHRESIAFARFGPPIGYRDDQGQITEGIHVLEEDLIDPFADGKGIAKGGTCFGSPDDCNDTMRQQAGVKSGTPFRGFRIVMETLAEEDEAISTNGSAVSD